MFEHFALERFAFLFDVDGTLIDIALTPDAVQVPVTLRRNIAQLRDLAGGAVALVSGRSIENLDFQFSPIELTVVGGHGAEIRLLTNGKAEQHRPPPLGIEIRRRCGEIAAQSDKILLEDKGYSIAIHYRLAPDRQQAIEDEVTALCEQYAAERLEVLHGKAVVEIKRSGVNKGSAVRTLMRHAPFAGRRPIFVGDDITDEDAFEAVNEFGGVAISVGRLVEGVSRRFETPADVRRWVEQLCERGLRDAATHGTKTTHDDI